MIWRLLMSESGRCIGECRKQEQKETSFFCLNEQTGKILWEELKLDEPWWLGLEAVQKNIILVHGFVKPDLPQHYGIQAFEVETGRQVWARRDLTYWFGVQDIVYAYKDLFEKRIGYAVNLHTGEIQQTFESSDDELLAARRKANEELLLLPYRFPELAMESECPPAVWSIIQGRVKGKGIAGNPEYIQERGYLLFNYFARDPKSSPQVPSLENRFIIQDLERKKIVFEDVLSRNVPNPAPDSFFVNESFVYFINNGNELQALRLWK
ncbi:MAG: DUF4905 domain-containing protein [bacterium]